MKLAVNRTYVAMSKCCGFGKCTGALNCIQRGYEPPYVVEPDYPLKGEGSGFGWFLIIFFTLLLPVPDAVIAEMFGETLGPWVFLALVVGFPFWAIHEGTKPYNTNSH